MKLLHSFPLAVFSLVLLSIGALCVAQRSLQLLLVAGTLAAISWYVTEGPRGRTLPRWVSNLLVIGVSLNVFVDFLQHRHDPLGVLGRFAVWLTLIKLYERRTARDHAQLMLLSLLLMITGCLVAPADFIMGIALLAYCALGLYVLLLHQLYSAFERSREARLTGIPAGYRLAPPLRPIVGGRAGLHFRSQAAAIGGVGALLSILCFIGLPRDVGADLFGRFQIQGRSRQTQFVNQVDLIEGGRITDNHIRAMSVKLTDSNDHALKLEKPLLLRGGVCDRYEGHGHWHSAAEDRSRRIDIPARQPVVLGAGEVEAGPVITQRVSFARAGSRFFTLYAPFDFAANEAMALQYDDGTQTLFSDAGCMTSGYVARIQQIPSDRTVEKLVDYIPQGIPGERWPSDEPLHQLAQQVLSRAGVPLNDRQRVSRGEEDSYVKFAAAAAAFTQFLQSGDYRYTLDLSDVAARRDVDPIVQFLTETRRGHCEYFASALAALCHSVGVPARIVTGFVAYEYDDAEQRYDVFESNAHAWVEVLTGKYRWTAFDPTPPQALDVRHDDETFADTMRSFYQRLEGNWSSSIVDFDSGAQDRLAQTLNLGWSKRFGEALGAIRDWMERVNIFFNVGPGGYIWMGIVAAVLVIAIIALVKLMRRSRAIRRLTGLQHVHGAEYQRLLRQLGFYLDMLRVLRKGGIAKPDWQPPLAFARALAVHRSDAAEPILAITSLFYSARYGGRRLTPEEQAQVRARLAQLAAVLKVRRK